MTDLRDLCARMADKLDHYRQLLMDDRSEVHALAAEARAALAEPEPEGPTDEEIMELMPQQMHEDLAAAARAMVEQTGVDSVRVKGLMRIILNRVLDLGDEEPPNDPVALRQYIQDFDLDWVLDDN